MYSNGDVELINPDTGETWTVDYYQLCGRGMPDGYVAIDQIGTKGLIAIIDKLRGELTEYRRLRW